MDPVPARAAIRALAYITLSLAVGCAKAPPEAPPPEPVVGYYTIAGHTCYAPPDLAALSRSELQKARVSSAEEVKALWRGEVDPGIHFSGAGIDELDDRFLSYPLDLGPVLAENNRLCEAWTRGEVTPSEWEKGLLTFARQFDKGRCEPEAFGYIAHNLSVTAPWQLELKLCRGQVINIHVGEGKYAINYPLGSKDEPVWIGAEGDPDRKAKGDDWPCPYPTCAPGQVIGRFIPWEGEPVIFPVGKGLRYEATSHGTLSLRINDDTFQDNRFRSVDQLPEFLVVEIKPAEL